MSAPRDARPRLGAAYFGNRYLSHAQRDLAVLARSCHYVVHTLSETDLHFHKHAMEGILGATRRLGLETWVDPWGVGGVFGGEAVSRFLLEHPNEWQKLSSERRVPAACLNSPAFRRFVRLWLENAVNLGADVIFWDEPHFFFHWDLEWEGTYSCACDRCAEMFQARFDRPLPEKLDKDVRLFRRDTLKGFLGELMDEARKKKVRNALCLYAFDGYEDYETLWNELAALPALDIFGCDPYWRWPPRVNKPPREHVARYAAKVVSAVKPLKKKSQIWIQAMRFRKGVETEIDEAVQAAVREGVTHLAAWSYDGGALLDTVLAEDPPRVWAAVEKAFARYRR
jgi:hypothetical protein